MHWCGGLDDLLLIPFYLLLLIPGMKLAFARLQQKFGRNKKCCKKT